MARFVASHVHIKLITVIGDVDKVVAQRYAVPYAYNATRIACDAITKLLCHGKNLLSSSDGLVDVSVVSTTVATVPTLLVAVVLSIKAVESTTSDASNPSEKLLHSVLPSTSTGTSGPWVYSN